MSNPNEKLDRRRNPASGRGNLSPWHFASQPDLKDAKQNLVSEVNVIGARYSQNPTEADSTLLLRYFHGYFLKYVSLLVHGTISKDGKKVPSDTKHFLALFRLKGSKDETMSMAEMKAIAERIPNAFITMEADDVYNEVVTIFLELARKFNPEIGGFTGYISHHFKYSLKGRMFQIQRDALNYIPLYEQTIEDNDFEDQEADDEISKSFSSAKAFFEEEEISDEFEDGYRDSNPKLLEAIGLRSLNYSFVSNPPGNLEDLLTKVQRRILVLHFCEGMSFSQISKHLNFGNATSIKAEYDKAIEVLQHIADVEVLEVE